MKRSLVFIRVGVASTSVGSESRLLLSVGRNEWGFEGEIGKGLGGIGLDEGCLVDDGDFARRER